MYCLPQKVKRLKEALKDWNRTTFDNIHNIVIVVIYEVNRINHISGYMYFFIFYFLFLLKKSRKCLFYFIEFRTQLFCKIIGCEYYFRNCRF